MEEMEFVYQEEYISNSRGVQLFTCRWLPACTPKALVFLCHGYGMECSGFMRGCGTRLAGAGYGVFGIDYEGHGRSQGARCYIKKFENIINDSDDFYKSICEHEEYRDKGRFLYGESMGGAVALLLHRKDPAFYNGAVLVAPMCKISEKVKPHPVVVHILTRIEEIIPKWKIVPTKDVIDAAFKDPVKREEVTLPFFVLHGEADTVTDPEVSQALYNRAGSSDKTMKLYPGMWHGLTSGEPDQSVEVVFADIIAWLDRRTGDGLTIQPMHSRPKPVETRMASRGNRKRRQRHQGSFLLCGWKGGMHQLSAM